MSGNADWGSDEFFGNDLWMYSVSTSFYDGVETVVVIGGVVDSANGAVRFDQGVRSFHHIADTHFLLLFAVASMGVFDAVFEVIFGRGLKDAKSIIEQGFLAFL